MQIKTYRILYSIDNSFLGDLRDMSTASNSINSTGPLITCWICWVPIQQFSVSQCVHYICQFNNFRKHKYRVYNAKVLYAQLAWNVGHLNLLYFKLSLIQKTYLLSVKKSRVPQVLGVYENEIRSSEQRQKGSSAKKAIRP